MNMYETFFGYLNRFDCPPLSDEEKMLFQQAFIPFKLKKRQCLLLAGEQCKNFAFIVKGAMRQYSEDDKGTEHIVRLGVEGWWMGDRESWVSGTPSLYTIDAWEDTEMLLVSRANMLELLRKVPLVSEMMRQLDERNHIANQRRLTSSISATAEKKYTDFAECHPRLLERFPQHIIASYLGITKDTLSRVKRNLLQK
ncbi:cAMP-binding domain of CRP or a regulatory subunit of cAMP-dependent protein kinases [Pedobacter westerhofensis]|jgi:CRP-like cAMP-binding protein|uniref:cAMP-binding domain of CRP or a regulatory subunit of cAMP-dependent protein kinases n=1 Tax=Pedobacter westerhofensis TaxID=425512 RepID=A0A521ATE2_9SPHI|nr:Crp/Fnr family transcriptional regulator [Pedobacter westerhofensis]SMO38083.1 cAMP-binding domain of CRP or a regulatory subunit of cAMP-dependent protein kinases [Pedobacter westerhofensis]